MTFAGSVTWLGGAFDRHDLRDLRSGAAAIPGFEPGRSGLAVVSLSGTAPDLGRDDGPDLVWGPADVVSMWDGES